MKPSGRPEYGCLADDAVVSAGDNRWGRRPRNVHQCPTMAIVLLTVRHAGKVALPDAGAGPRA